MLKPIMFKPLILAATLLLAGNAVAKPVTYKIDANHTVVVASWSHFGFSHPVANFGQVDGSIVYDADNAGQSSVKVTIPLAGLDTRVPDFDEHLRGADFFDAQKYPEITFSSNRVEAAGDTKLRVFGDLTVHGVTKPVVLDVTINKVADHPMYKRAFAGFDATTTVKRSDFGMGDYTANVSDEVTIRITTEAAVPKPGTEAKANADKK